MAVVTASVAAFDGGYYFICQAYSFNFVSEALLWPLPNLPVDEMVKEAVRSAKAGYPAGEFHGLARSRVWRLYLLVEVPAFMFWAYAARKAAVLARYTAHGVLGLGANFDMGTWHEDLAFKRHVLQSAGEAAHA
eukprot:CAMPEP_0117553666 /NCGR_PEP_ID=MMETSP0784-20121206/50343_1 /TAXON_ID=39447 /ORGANISM="" /LENGTH=133 /DNA_ID=CAMNT_0005350781 /DNA_START=300 /DNA_END=697 /DNA_ORIENTATION=+